MDSTAGTVLVVDDEPNNTDMLKRRLERSNFQVDTAGSGPEALERVADSRYDVVLLDMMMPGMDGFEVLSRLRSEQITSDLPVIMVTAKSSSEDISHALELGADDYVTKPVDYQVLLSRLQSHLNKKETKRSLETLNSSLNDKVRRRTKGLREAHDRLQSVADTMTAVLWQAEYTEEAGFRLLSVDGAVEALLGTGRSAMLKSPQVLMDLVDESEREQLLKNILDSLREKQSLSCEVQLPTAEGGRRWVYLTGRRQKQASARIDGVILDITERKHLETQLLQTQKLESVGQLASGIAHEINSPAQYTRDNIGFLSDSFVDLMRYVEAQKELFTQIEPTLSDEQRSEITRIEREIDLDFIVEEVPAALNQGIDGITRISKIVKAMKGFTHPGSEAPESCDLNKLIEDTTVVAAHEWKYVANLNLELDSSLEFVNCFPSELGQVILNLVVNAAHAIEEAAGDSGSMGEITIKTAKTENGVEVRIKDDGPGIPATLQNKIFDPFFTTKVVGKGTGQGLSIARSVIVDKHHGDLSIEQTGPAGTTFLISLPTLS